MAKLRKTKKSELSEEELAHFRAAQQLQFWRYEYTKRKFWLDFPPGSERYKELEIGHACLCLPLTNGLTPISKTLAQRVIRSEIIRYHNALSQDPKFFFKDIFYLRELYEAISLTVAFIREYQSQQIAQLHDVAFTYGYYFEDLLKPQNAEKILKRVQDGNYHLNLEPFLRKDDDANNVCRFSYADRSGEQFFEDEKDGVIYIYLQVDGSDCDPDVALEKLPGILKSGRSSKKVSRGDRDKSNLQICISKKFGKLSVDDISRWCKYAIISYKNWLYPLGNMVKAETLNLLWVIEGVMYEQMPPDGRAIGLWIWDLVNFEGKKVSEAVEFLQTKKKVRDATTDLRQFQRYMRLTEDCIKHMQPLNGTQSKPLAGPGGLIK